MARLTSPGSEPVYRAADEVADAPLTRNPWDGFAYWANRFYTSKEFEIDERDYKLRIAEHVVQARQCVLADDPDWFQPLKKAFGPPNNLTHHIQHGRFLAWCAESPRARDALRALWSEPAPDPPLVGSFLEHLPREVVGGPGTRLNIASFLAMALGPERYPIYLRNALKSAFSLTGFPMPPADADEPALYEHALRFFDEVKARLARRGVPLRDRLDAQSVAWAVTQWSEREKPVIEWPDRAALLAYRTGTPPPPARAWIFQGDPSTDPDLIPGLRRARPGDVAPWRVSRYGNEMRPGDPVVVWLAGATEGIHAIGEIAGAPYDRELPSWDRVDPASTATGQVIDVRYTRLLSAPIPRAAVAAHASLRDLGVLDIARQSNYRVTPEQWPALAELLADSYRAPTFDEIKDGIAALGLRVSDRTLRRYHLALRTRGFVILSGLSGAGKTWLAQAYAQVVGATAQTVPVAPNWTSNEDLLGYVNPLGNQYQDTAASRFLRAAARAQREADAHGVAPRPYHLVLDEMNLARVEFYFARFLSAMEIRARGGDARLELAADDVISLPPNLHVIGTVNVDETTHGFADKVYDRAQLIEIDVSRAELADHLGERPYAERLLAVWDTVHHVAPFAFRVLDEIAAYVDGAAAMGVPWQEALDEQLLQKVLPKLKGAASDVAASLDGLVALTKEDFPLTHTKAGRMLADAQQHGFASYF